MGLICYVTSSFSTADSLYVFYTTLVWPELEHTSVAWNTITMTDSFTLRRVQTKFTSYVIADFLWVYVAIIMKVF
jgi:hypothetical protein